jgi:hypothetical protein
MIRRMNKSHVGMVIDNGGEEEDISYCSTCMAAGELVRLKQRIYLDSAGKLLPPPPDAEDWRQCWTCGLTVPTIDVKKQGKISGIQGIETIDNKFDYGRGVILGNDSRLSSRIKNLKRQKTKHPDAEVQRMIDDGYELVDYRQDIPT